MKDAKQREQLTMLVERRRQELRERPDVSQKTRELSQSSSRNAIYPQVKRKTLVTAVAAGLGAVVVVALVIAAIVVTVGGVWFQNQLSDPSVTIQQFYSALHQQQYSEAYKYFTPAFQTREPLDQFTNQYSSDDTISGVVESYPISSSKVSGDTAVVVVDVVRRGNSNSAQVQTLHLIKSGNSWLIDSITIGGYVPAPTSTANNGS